MSRSKWKGPSIACNFLITKEQRKKKFCRSGIILPAFLNNTLKIYNGQALYYIKVTNSLIGFRFGEFISTRKKFIFKKS